MAENTFVAMDPMSMILSGAAYKIWLERKHPHVPKVSEIQEVFRSMAPSEQKTALARARRLAGYGKAVDEAVQTMKK
jgi:hypothetical protein